MSFLWTWFTMQVFQSDLFLNRVSVVYPVWVSSVWEKPWTFQFSIKICSKVKIGLCFPIIINFDYDFVSFLGEHKRFRLLRLNSAFCFLIFFCGLVLVSSFPWLLILSIYVYWKVYYWQIKLIAYKIPKCLLWPYIE